MTCFDLSKMSTSNIDANKVISIPIRTPYNLEIKDGISCPGDEQPFYYNKIAGIELASSAYLSCELNFKDRDIILDQEDSEFLLQLRDKITCSVLSAKHIYCRDSITTLKSTDCQSFYVSNTFLDESNSTSTLCVLNDVVLKDSAIHSSDIMLITGNNNNTFLDSQIKSRYLLSDSAININKNNIDSDLVLSLDSCISEDSNINGILCFFENTHFINSSINLQEIQTIPDLTDIKDIQNFLNELSASTFYKKREYTDYVRDDKGLIQKGINATFKTSDIQNKIRQMSDKMNPAPPDEEDPPALSSFVNLSQFLGFVDTQPFDFKILNAFKSCSFDNTNINSEIFFAYDCDIKNSSLLFSQILSTLIIGEDTKDLTNFKNLSIKIGKLDTTPIKPLILDNSHLKTKDFFGPITINDNSSLECDRFFSFKATIDGTLKIKNQEISLKDLGIKDLGSSGILQLVDFDSVFYIDNPAPKSTMLGTLEGTEFTIELTTQNGTNSYDHFVDCSIKGITLTINISKKQNMEIYDLSIENTLSINKIDLTVIQSLISDVIYLNDSKITNAEANTIYAVSGDISIKDSPRIQNINIDDTKTIYISGVDSDSLACSSGLKFDLLDSDIQTIDITKTMSTGFISGITSIDSLSYTSGDKLTCVESDAKNIAIGIANTSLVSGITIIDSLSYTSGDKLTFVESNAKNIAIGIANTSLVSGITSIDSLSYTSGDRLDLIQSSISESNIQNLNTIYISGVSDIGGTIICNNLIIGNSTNNAAIKCKNLTWVNSVNAGSVDFENGIYIDDTYSS